MTCCSWLCSLLRIVLAPNSANDSWSAILNLKQQNLALHGCTVDFSSLWWCLVAFPLLFCSLFYRLCFQFSFQVSSGADQSPLIRHPELFSQLQLLFAQVIVFRLAPGVARWFRIAQTPTTFHSPNSTLVECTFSYRGRAAMLARGCAKVFDALIVAIGLFALYLVKMD